MIAAIIGSEGLSRVGNYRNGKKEGSRLDRIDDEWENKVLIQVIWENGGTVLRTFTEALYLACVTL